MGNQNNSTSKDVSPFPNFRELHARGYTCVGCGASCRAGYVCDNSKDGEEEYSFELGIEKSKKEEICFYYYFPKNESKLKKNESVIKKGTWTVAFVSTDFLGGTGVACVSCFEKIAIGTMDLPPESEGGAEKVKKEWDSICEFVKGKAALYNSENELIKGSFVRRILD